MDKLQQYISRATRGLYGAKKLEIQAELRGSIEARIWQLEMQGNINALETALLEMGAAKTINSGLLKEHLMPKIFKSAVLAGFFVVVSIATLSSSRAQIETIYSPTLATFGISPAERKLQIFYLSLSSIKANLEAAGLSVDDTASKPQERSNAFKGKTVPTLRFRFPDAQKDTWIQTAPGYDSPWKDDSGKFIFNPKPNKDVGYERFYLNFWAFLRQMRTSGLPIQIQGWKNPFLRIGQTRLQIGTNQNPVQPSLVYWSIAGRAIQKPSLEMISWSYLVQASIHAVRINAPVGTVYSVITPMMQWSQKKLTYHIDVARVDDKGILYFKAPHTRLEFAKTKEAIWNDQKNVKSSNYGHVPHPAKVILLRMNPDLTTILETPMKTRSAAIK